MKSLDERVEDRKQREADAQKAAEENGNKQPESKPSKRKGKGKPADSEEVEETEYESMTVAELKAELDERGVEYASGALKADLIAALEENDG